jgi:hypothetical protein
MSIEAHAMASFVDEMLKLGYSPKGHKLLGGAAAESMGEMSQEAKDAVVEGSVGADMGIRFPLFPWTDRQHAFPTQTREDVHRHISVVRRRGADDIAKAVAEGGALAQMRAARGLMDIGEGAHTVADFGSHYEKPAEMGAESSVMRGVLQKMPEPFFGGAASLVEHLRTGYELDTLDPKSSKADRRTLKRIKQYGADARSDIEAALRDKHGMGGAEAKKRAKAFMKGLRPSTASRAAAMASRNAAYVGAQMARAAGGVVKTRRKVRESLPI